jgi:hypothetical protein
MEDNLRKHLIAYFDLLGFSNVVQTTGQEYEKIIPLLENLKKSEGNPVYETTNCDGVTREYSVSPGVSAFSDHVVLSFPLSDLEKIGMGLVLIRLAQEAAGIFCRAIEFGCLIRGGVTIGRLHHRDGVVVGPGLVAAYKIESTLARHPRIVLDNQVIQSMRDPRCHLYLTLHDDGYYSLDYVRAAFDAIPLGPAGPSQMKPRRQWIERVRRTCSRQINELSRAESQGGLQKWRWFKEQFERFVEQLDPKTIGC